jgi:protein FrlC
MFDTFHALYRNEVSAEYVRQMGRDLVHVHFADIDRSAPGDDVIDWESLLLALNEIRFEGHITMEIGFNKRSTDPDALARRSLRGFVTLLGSVEPIADECRFRQQCPQRHAMPRKPRSGTDASLQT